MLDHLFLYKFINGLIDCPDLQQQINYSVPFKRVRFSRYLPFISKGFKTNLGHFCVVNRIQTQFNRLSRSANLDIDMSYSLPKFKHTLVASTTSG